MRRSLVLVALGFAALAASPASAQTCAGRDLMALWAKENPERVAEIRTAAEAMPNGRNALWKIVEPEAPQRRPSFLYGTLATTDDRVKSLAPVVREALLEARRVAVEIEDPSPNRHVEALKALGERGGVFLPAQTTLNSLLSGAEAARASHVLGKAGLDATLSARVKPWVPLVLAATSECELSRMRGRIATLDQSLQQNAETRGLGSVGMETVELRLRSMSRLEDADQLALLKARLAIQERADDITETFITLWLAKDLGALWPVHAHLAQAAGVDGATLERYRQVAVAERATRMLGRIHGHLKRGNLFIAADAMLLPGPDGMIEKLRASGFTVTALD
jgi:uncharacterized protein YbaP (TraB family)